MRSLVRLAPVAAALSGALAPVAAFAQTATPLDYSGITGAIDLGTTTAAIMTVGGIVALVAVATMGVRKVLRMIK